MIVWLWVALNGVLLVALIVRVRLTWREFETRRRAMEASHAAERARFEARRQAWEQYKKDRGL